MGKSRRSDACFRGRFAPWANLPDRLLCFIASLKPDLAAESAAGPGSADIPRRQTLVTDAGH